MHIMHVDLNDVQVTSILYLVKIIYLTFKVGMRMQNDE